MAKKVRFNGAVEAFASQAIGTERTVFGDVTQSNDIDQNLNPDWLRGWGIVGVNDLPTKQDFNAAAYTLGYLLSYIYQFGVAEWNATQDYHLHSIVNVAGILYKSLQDNNTNQNPTTSPLWWSRSGATGDMLKSENLSGLANYTTARANLGVMGFKGTAITSASTTNIGNADSHFVDVTGTTTITSFGTGTARNIVMVNFTDVLTLTHNPASLVLPSGANIITAAGDTAIFARNGAAGSDNWRCIAYQRANGTAVIAPPVVFTNEWVSAEQTITAAGTLTIAHNLGVKPKTWDVFLVCQTAEHNFSVGDILKINMERQAGTTTPGGGVEIVWNTANAVLRYGNATNPFYSINFSTGAVVVLTNANWRLILKGWV